MKTILAIDPGLMCGWAKGQVKSLNDWSISGSGVWNLNETRYQGKGWRFIALREHLKELLPADFIVYEKVRRHESTLAAHAYGGFLATIQTFADDNKISYGGVEVKHVKKHATGNGNASKYQMLQMARIRFGKHINDHNQADALFILSRAIQEMF